MLTEKDVSIVILTDLKCQWQNFYVNLKDASICQWQLSHLQVKLTDNMKGISWLVIDVYVNLTESARQDVNVTDRLYNYN